MPFLDDSDGSEADKEDVKIAIVDIVAHFIQINADAGDFAPVESSPYTNEECFSHIATVSELMSPYLLKLDFKT